MKTEDQLLPAIGIILFATLCFAAMDTTGKFLTAQLPAIMVVWGRTLFQTVFAAGYLGAVAGPKFFVTHRPLAQFIRSITLTSASLLVYYALSHVPLADVIAAMFFGPILVALFSAIFLREKIGIHRIGAILAGFAGILLILRPGMADASPWLLLALAAAVLNAVYLMLTRFLSDPVERRAAQFHTTSIGAIVLTLAIAYFWQTPDLTGFALLTLMGLLGTIGHFSLVTAFKYAPASLLSPFLYSQVFFSMLSSVLFFGDRLTSTTLAGTLLLVASGIYIWWRERKLGVAHTKPPAAH